MILFVVLFAYITIVLCLPALRPHMQILQFDLINVVSFSRVFALVFLHLNFAIENDAKLTKERVKLICFFKNCFVIAFSLKCFVKT